MSADPTPDAIQAVREAFAKKLPRRLSGMCDAVELAARTTDPDDIREARAHVHRLAGVAGSFGFADLGKLAADLERHLEADLPDWDRLIRLAQTMRDG